MDKETTSSVDKVLTLLNHLSDQYSVSVAEASCLLDVDKSTAYRLLKKIESYGFATKSGKKYHFASKLHGLSYLEPTPYAVSEFCEDILKNMVEQTNIGVHLCMLSQKGATFINQKFPADIIRIVQPIGKEEPFYCTASGKVMLAYLPQDIRSKLIDEIEYKAFTDKTITTKERLLEQLDIIREQGYALDEGEYHVNVNCICVPIRDGFHIPRYALGFSKLMMPNEEFHTEQLKKILVRNANRISGYLNQAFSSADS